MVQLLGEVRIHQFLEQLIARFQLGEYEKNSFSYTFHCNEADCTIGYERQNKLFARNYNFTIVIEKAVATVSPVKQQIHYSFHKKRWVTKQENALLQIANKHFLLAWDQIDFLSLTMTEAAGKRTLKMCMLPGSYTALIFPPMKQGIDMHEEEVHLLRHFIDSMSQSLHQRT